MSSAVTRLHPVLAYLIRLRSHIPVHTPRARPTLSLALSHHGSDYEAREQHAGIVLLHRAEQKYADQQWAVSVSDVARCL